MRIFVVCVCLLTLLIQGTFASGKRDTIAEDKIRLRNLKAAKATLGDTDIDQIPTLIDDLFNEKEDAINKVRHEMDLLTEQIGFDDPTTKYLLMIIFELKAKLKTLEDYALNVDDFKIPPPADLEYLFKRRKYQTLVLPDNSTYVGDVIRGKPHGEGKLTSANGKTITEGGFLKGKLHGHCSVYNLTNLARSEASYSYGVKHGISITRWDNGLVNEEVWDEGINKMVTRSRYGDNWYFNSIDNEGFRQQSLSYDRSNLMITVEFYVKSSPNRPFSKSNYKWVS